MRPLALCLCAALIIGDAAAGSGCLEVRAAFDIGSGSTKMTVARVDRCAARVVEVLAPRSGRKLDRPVRYRKGIVSTSGGLKVFAPEVIEAGIAALSELQTVARAHGAERFAAVATSAFRQVAPAHAERVVGEIRTRLAIPVHVIAQEEEARIAFQSALVQSGARVEDVVVWDIGGGSMQISYHDHSTGRLEGYRGRFASEAMHEYVITELQGREYRVVASPNPMLGPEDWVEPDNAVSRAIHKAHSVAMASIPAEQRRHIAARSRLIGVGGVHYFSNCELMRRFAEDGCTFTLDELGAQTLALATLDDAGLVEAGLSRSLAFAPFRITGGALTAGFMIALGFERVVAVKGDLGVGILVDSAYWSE